MIVVAQGSSDCLGPRQPEFLGWHWVDFGLDPFVQRLLMHDPALLGLNCVCDKSGRIMCSLLHGSMLQEQREEEEQVACLSRVLIGGRHDSGQQGSRLIQHDLASKP